jgi:hypothetical protein
VAWLVPQFCQEKDAKMTARKNQYVYERMLRNVLPYVAPRGYTNVKADLPGQEKPEAIGVHTPSVSADGLLLEVETKDSLTSEQTRTAWKELAAHAVNTACRFIIVAPKGLEDIAKQQLKELQIIADVWTAA